MDYEDPPLKADKGKYLGSCNRRACQKPGANWFNRTMNAHYCEPCAKLINYEPLPSGEYLCVKVEPGSKFRVFTK